MRECIQKNRPAEGLCRVKDETAWLMAIAIALVVTAVLIVAHAAVPTLVGVASVWANEYDGNWADIGLESPDSCF